MASYPRVFTFYNQQVSVDRLPVYFEDAHSDWLQLVAELGLAGSLCIVLLVARPFFSIRKHRPLPPLAMYSFLGCTALVIYAVIEFPFGNNAVVASFWICFFAAIRLVQLEARERSA
jgi:O-antigen ligase